MSSRNSQALPLLPAQTWKLQAACLDALDPAAFDEDATPAQLAVARSWCQDCPVAVECFTAAAATAGGPAGTRAAGTWGGVMFRDGTPEPSLHDDPATLPARHNLSGVAHD